MHVLIPRTRHWVRIEPKSGDKTKEKFSWSCKVFKPEWQIGRHIHNELKMTTQQGYIGAAYEAGPFTGVKFGVLNDKQAILPDFNFSLKQNNLLQGLVMVACCAIPDVNNEGESLGVLSIDSYTDGSENLIKNDDNLKQLIEAMDELASALGDYLKDFKK